MGGFLEREIKLEPVAALRTRKAPTAIAGGRLIERERARLAEAREQCPDSLAKALARGRKDFG
jgi:hypothetical protein